MTARKELNLGGSPARSKSTWITATHKCGHTRPIKFSRHAQLAAVTDVLADALATDCYRCKRQKERG